MKKTLLFTIILISALVSNGQTKLYKGVYYYKNPKHNLKTYQNILIITNSSIKAQQSMKRIAKREGYKIKFLTDLFPPIKDYTDEEIAQGIKEDNVDAILYYTIKGSTETSTHSYGSYTIPSTFGIGSYSTITKTDHYTEMEVAFVEPNSKNLKELYCTGGVNGEAYGVSIAVFDEIFRQLKDMGIANPMN